MPPQPKARLELHCSVPQGREYEAAVQFQTQLPAEAWQILVGIAAEVVALQESRSQGATQVLVVPTAALAETKLAGLDRMARALRGSK